MKKIEKAGRYPDMRIRWVYILVVMLFLGLLFKTDALAFTLKVIDPEGGQVIGYRWLVEEDTTYDVIPGALVGDTLSVSFHKSYAPVVVKGESFESSVDVNVAGDKRYFVSILPFSEYTIGGAPVAAGQSMVTVTVNPQPIPTAQISVFVFEDNYPINNAPDLPEEHGLEGFSIVIADAGGRYGIAGGQMMMDAFGNMLGTTYQKDAQGNFIFNEDGTPKVAVMGDGVIKTDAAGKALIKYLAPGKYGVQAVPPTGQNWNQTSTIEGTKTIDAWVKANEPPFFVEFGPPGYHAFIGFVKPMELPANSSGNLGSISGQAVNLHNSRPPDMTFWPGAPVPNAWVGLNDLAVGIGKGIYAQPCDPATGEFTIQNVPPGNYQLVIWDEYLDTIFAFFGVTVPSEDNHLTLGQIPVFAWFTRLDNYVFYDMNENGFRDPDEPGMSGQAVNIRFRDGTIYQSLTTDTSGHVSFEEIFPFFHWLVAEVDFARFKATGATIVVDAGGPVLPDRGWDYPSWDELTPQQQAEINENTGNTLSRTETGMVLTQAFQGFMGQTSVIEWGKSNYGAGENGGISGIVYYATTRAENNPRYAAAEVWEPGIPRVQVNLYQDFDCDGIIDDFDHDSMPTRADVDNYPFGWAEGGLKGDEDVDYNENDQFDPGDAIQITTTDSWDDSLPTGCPGEPYSLHGVPTDCFDGLRNFNQVRPGVFDGGYAFTSYFPYGMAAQFPLMNEEVEGLPVGAYIVEAVTPPGYELVKEEDKNVDFGDEYTPSTLLLPPVCVGEDHMVPEYLTLFPAAKIEAPFAGQMRPLCNCKQITLEDNKNAAVDFFMFTEVPVAGCMVGFVLDDFANEFDSQSPTFGEKYSPPFLPISIRDFRGTEISRVYSDEFGAYNALVPSTYTANLPAPSGMSPNMLTVCINSPGPIPDPNNPGHFITDPFFNRQYSQFCYTFQYMPGTTTYLDTPVLPIAAFAGANQFPLDCEFPDGTPKIYSVSGPQGGPYVVNAGYVITIVSEGMVNVPNPSFDPDIEGSSATISRDYGFGSTPGTVTIGGVDLVKVSWSAGSISGTVAAGTNTGQLMVTRGDNEKSTPVGLTLTVGGVTDVVHVLPGGSIQDAIDTANPGALILVPPGNYEELVIMWKNIKLQGWGAGSTIINALNVPGEKLIAWREKMTRLIDTGAIDLLPGQPTGGGLPEPAAFNTEEGPGIIVVTKKDAFDPNPNNPRIDGFIVTGADHGGGIFVNGYARYLQISNNRIINNQGFYGGGIRIGHPYLTVEEGDELKYVDGENDNIILHHNHITQNGGLGAAGGGVAIFNGTDDYQITENSICGNFIAGDGAGIGHLGKSDQGLIADNTIIFNQSFIQGMAASGGGIFIGGLPPLGIQTLSPGSGSVTVNANLIQGNMAGAGDGGGIRTQFVNGQDVAASPTDPNNWYMVDIFNNMIVNNITGLAGGAISLQDTAKVNIINNTMANNDSTATASEAFSGGPSVSNPQPAGIVTRAHSTALASVIVVNPDNPEFSNFSNPTLVNNIVWHNRTFYWDVTVNDGIGGLLPDVANGDPPVFADLAVLGTAKAEFMDPRYCILTDTKGYEGSNIADDPDFVDEYFNGGRGQVVKPEVTTGIQTAPAFDEGGNFIDVRFGPLTLINPATGKLFGNYHITAGSPAINKGDLAILSLSALLNKDYDGQDRPNGAKPDIGADEFYSNQTDPMSPLTSDVMASPGSTNSAAPITLTARANADFSSGYTIAKAEWWEGDDPGMGCGNPMQAADGVFNAPFEGLITSIHVTGWSPGTHSISVRSQDIAGIWGPPSITFLEVLPPPQLSTAPEWIRTKRIDKTTIEITWADNSQNTDSYRIERFSGFNKGWELLNDSISGDSSVFLDKNAPRRFFFRYHYRICVENALGSSPWTKTNKRLRHKIESVLRRQRVRVREVK